MKTKNIVLVAVIVALVASIFYLESRRTSVPRIAPAGTGPMVPDGEKMGIYVTAPELRGIAGEINEEGISLEKYEGKVILIDFWTYSCINCIRTLPYLTSWYRKYKDDGFVIIGVHTPEFEFEKKYENVLTAVEKNSITYPVVQDNDYETWRAYKNRYWPRKYLIDINGNIRYDHIGEGAYVETEMMIQQLLNERMEALQVGKTVEAEITTPEERQEVDFTKIRTREVYFGYEFARGGTFGNVEGFKPGEVVSYQIPEQQVENKAYVEGDWQNNPGHLELVSGSGKIVLTYTAKDVNLVAGAEQPVGVDVFVDGVAAGTVTVQEERLYTVVSGEDYATRVLTLEANNPGLRVYTFTFG